jgi:hypothetical protein
MVTGGQSPGTAQLAPHRIYQAGVPGGVKHRELACPRVHRRHLEGAGEPDAHVCVLPETRAQAQQDNSQAGARRAGGGDFGPDTCKQGYVWREASPADHVCVTPETRTQTALDNKSASERVI